MKKTCFVISPIADQTTPERTAINAHANRVLELIIEPALEKFGFEMIRADTLATPERITEQMLRLVSEADLCVVVLTYPNPNVFYETGRRHESGKPCIHLLESGRTMPFDVYDYRVVQYPSFPDNGFADPYQIRVAVKDLQRMVEHFEQTGYGIARSAISLQTIAQQLERIEQKLVNGSQPRHGVGQPPLAAQPSTGMLHTNPKEAFLRAVMSGDHSSAAAMLPRIRSLSSVQEYVTACAVVAASGEEVGAQELLQMVAENQNLDTESLKAAIGGIVQFYNLTDREREVIDKLDPIFRSFETRAGLPDEERAFMLNQQQKLLYGAGEYDRALAICERVIELAPLEIAYRYNASLICEQLALLPRAAALADQYIAMIKQKDDPEEDNALGQHLSHAVEMYAKVGRRDDAKQIFLWLERIDRGRAQMILVDRVVKQAVGR